MWNVLVLQFKRLIKEPLTVSIFLGLTVAFVFFLSGTVTGMSSINVPVFTDELSEEEASEWLDQLNEDETFVFELESMDRIEEQIRMNDIPFAVELQENTYRYLIGRDSEDMALVDQHVQRVYREAQRLEQVQEEYPDQNIEVNQYIEIEQTSLVNSTTDEGERVDVYVLFGMVFYFVGFSVMFQMSNLVREKQMGTWDRMILTPLSKIKIYMGHLIHYYLIGLGQVGISLLILTQLMNYNLGNNYVPMMVTILVYVFTIVSLGILVISLSPSIQALQVVIPLIATGTAMLGGAWWPLEIVDNEFILTTAEFMPIKHGMEAMIDAINYNAGISDLFYPLGALLLMGILFMGIGMNLMERTAE